MREQHKHKTLHINFLYSKSIPSPAKHNKKSSFYPVSQSWGTMISSTPHSTLLLSTVVIQLKSNRWGLIHWQASASKSVIHSQGRERESLCWLFSSAHFLNESIPCETCENTPHSLFDHTPSLYTLTEALTAVVGFQPLLLSPSQSLWLLPGNWVQGRSCGWSWKSCTLAPVYSICICRYT